MTEQPQSKVLIGLFVSIESKKTEINPKLLQTQLLVVQKIAKHRSHIV